MKQLVHGGDWMGYRERFGRDALDFSANVSPLGLPEGVAQAIRDALPLADRYPDPLCRTLRAALSRAEGVPQERILCGNGAADLIFRLVWAVKPHKALVTAPTFAEYASALDTVECEVKRFFLDETNDFAPTDALVDAVDESIDMVFLCQPNNPTFPTYCYLIHSTLIRYCRTGFPHSDISGSMLICSSPKLFAACHVLHRLLMPRHSPCALISLTSSQQTSYPSPCRRRQVSSIPLLLLFKSKPAFRFEISGSQIIIE